VLTHPGPANGVSDRISEHLGSLLRIPVAVRNKDFNNEEEGIEEDPFRVSVDSTQAAILLTVSVFLITYTALHLLFSNHWNLTPRIFYVCFSIDLSVRLCLNTRPEVFLS